MTTTVIHVRDADFSDPDTVYIGRQAPRWRLRRSFWANPFGIGKDGDRATVIAMYRRMILDRRLWRERIHELRGKRLACWCKPEACHGDVLAELADSFQMEPAGEEQR